jgi:hypothetical protein
MIKKVGLSKEVVQLPCHYTVVEERNINSDIWANVSLPTSTESRSSERAAS